MQPDFGAIVRGRGVPPKAGLASPLGDLPSPERLRAGRLKSPLPFPCAFILDAMYKSLCYKFLNFFQKM